MSTFNHNLTRDWSLIRSGPINALSIQATDRAVNYRVETTIPTDNDQESHQLNPREGHGVVLTGADNLYARTVADTDNTILIRTE